MTDQTGTPPGPPEGAEAYLGPAFDGLYRFARLLEDQGVLRGLIGPREVPRLWDRHLLNSAAMAACLPETGTVIDVGTGAGLPGIVLAVLRPDLRTVLVEPMDRRTTWLREVVDELGLESVEVVQARAEELHGSLRGDAVTARAVAPLDRLARWTFPLVADHGVLLAMKGARAEEEVSAARALIETLGGGVPQLLHLTSTPGAGVTTVVRVVRERPAPDTRTLGSGARRGSQGSAPGGAPARRARAGRRRP